MPVSQPRPLAIVVAVEEELRAIIKKMPLADQQSANGISFYKGKIGGREVVLAKSGMGAERAHLLVRKLIGACAPDSLLICGYGAGLSPSVSVGDIVFASGLFGASPIAQQNGPPHLQPSFISGQGGLLNLLKPHEYFLQSAGEIKPAGYRLHTGLLITAPRVVGTAREKAAIAKGTGLLALDMETLGAATAANAVGVPWAAARAITDGLEDDLPLSFEQFVDASGEASRGKIIAHVLTHPRLIPKLIKLGGRASLAARNLADFVEEYVRVMVLPH
jgi:adenosylhomocysteine nucleosidase